MKQASEKEQEQRQRRAYENRECVQPGDVLSLRCSRADEMTAGFRLPGGGNLISPQEPGAELKKGDTLHLSCTAATIGENGYGRFVDYVFEARETGHRIILNGPDAQALAEKKTAPTVIHNRDIPTLTEVLSIMQTVCQIERRREWQRDRMLHITQSLTGMPGGGSPKGLDDVIAALDDITIDQGRECLAYTHQLRAAQRILNGIESQSMRAFVLMKYVMGCSDTEIRNELNMTRRGFERAKRSVESARSMTAVKWQERYILDRQE